MDYESIKSYQGQFVNLTLKNTFWYRCKIMSVEEDSVKLVEENGKRITVTPEAVMMILEVKR